MLLEDRTYSPRAAASPFPSVIFHERKLGWCESQGPIEKRHINFFMIKKVQFTTFQHSINNFHYFHAFQHFRSQQSCLFRTGRPGRRPSRWMKARERPSNKRPMYNIVPGDKRRVMTKNVAILADSLPLSASKHNTMFLKTWQHLLWVYFSCVSEPKQKQATS